MKLGLEAVSPTLSFLINLVGMNDEFQNKTNPLHVSIHAFTSVLLERFITCLFHTAPCI